MCLLYSLYLVWLVIFLDEHKMILEPEMNPLMFSSKVVKWKQLQLSEVQVCTYVCTCMHIM